VTNIYKTPEKKEIRDRLFNAALRALREQGWTTSRVVGAGRSSVRRIAKDGRELLVSIKTTQDQYIGFVPADDGKNWETLDDVEMIIVASVDDSVPPRTALVHQFDAAEVRSRFDQTMKARRASGIKDKESGRGPWLPLYKKDPTKPRYAGGGLGLDFPPIARYALADLPAKREMESETPAVGVATPAPEQGLKTTATSGSSVIAEAKRLIARGLNVPESAIRITIEA
jgi:hypothetical protein